MEPLQESNIIKVISKKLVRKSIEMLHKQAEKDESKKDKDGGIDDDTKEAEITEVAETDNNELVVNAANNAPPPQDAMTNTAAAAAEETGTTTTWAPRTETATMMWMIPRGGDPEVKYGNDNNDENGMMSVLPPLE